MKFSDGNWMMREGVRANYAAEAHEADVKNGTLTILAPTHPIRHRGDTLSGPNLTVRFSSPLPDVIRVRISHFAGKQDRGPHFGLEAEDGVGEVNETDDAHTLTSGRLTVRAAKAKGNWAVEFRDDTGRIVTRSAPRGMGYATIDRGEDAGTYLHEQLTLGVGENVYGLGERFTAFVKNGQVVEIWNKDGGTGSDQAYKNIPFYLTNRGYGVFVNQPENVSFEVASEKVSRVQFSVAGESLDYFVIYGPTPKEVLEKYTALTGRPALPPAWTFGLWLTTSFTTNYDEASVTDVLEEMTRRDLPLHVFHFDCFWMREFRWCDFEWDTRVFPDPVGMLRRLHERGLKVCVWINSYIGQQSPLFAEAVSQGFLLKRTNGNVWQTDQWQPGMGIVDFTNPAACAWYAGKLRALLTMGVDSFKTDFGERIPTDDVAWFDGSNPQGMHNYYTQLYNQTVFQLLETERGTGEAALFARSATAGGQKFPVHWGGDCYSSFESMAESLRGGLSLGLSGFGFWSHDIGGFEGKPPAEVYKRWIAFGLLSSHSRLHGSSSYRVPWLFDEEAVDVLRFFTRLKCRLMPYLWAKAVEAHQTGLPVMRPMLLEFPDDPACDGLDRQYLLGESLIVVPVFSSDNTVSYYVPAGRWTHFLTGETVEGPRWVREESHGFQSLPLLVRPGTVLPIGAEENRPDYEFADGVELRVYAFADGQEATVSIPALDGQVTALSVHVRRDGSQITAKADRMDVRWSLRVVGGDTASPAPGTDFCTVNAA